MISVNDITVRFGGVALFKDVTFMINLRDRIGLVGKNGSGKSTLLKVILGKESYDTGEVSVPGDITFGYLPQQMKITNERTVFNEALLAFDEVLKLKKQISEINEQLAERTDYESEDYIQLINKLTETNERFDLLGGASIDADIERILLGLGFERKDFNRPTSEFSGGWRMRIELAKILLKKPDIFLLDEPTNHLDIESIQWLEDFLKEYDGAVLLISHDRAFLDAVTTRTLEISLGGLNDYSVPYSRFVKLREERRQQQMAAYNNQQKMIEETERFIERFRYKATKAVQVQSRIKQLEKLDRIEVDEEETGAIHFRFPPAPRSGDVVIETKNLTKKYGNYTVLSDIHLTVERGERIAFVGRNGEGKTTLSKILVGELDYEGHLKTGHNVNIGYYAQNQDLLMDGEKTVFQTIDDIAVGDVRTRIRTILGSFLFSGETIDKKVSVLSGGERSRLALAKLILEPYNLLILDEPTNHLDMRSKEILKQALLHYDGTLIAVSHDRDFLNNLVTKVYEFKNQKIKESIGGIYDFLHKKKIESLRDIEEKQQKAASENKKSETAPSENKKLYFQRKEYEKELRKIRNKIAKSEQHITELEEEIESCDEKLKNPDQQTLDREFYKNYEKLKSDLEAEMQTWERLNIKLEEAEEKAP